MPEARKLKGDRKPKDEIGFHDEDLAAAGCSWSADVIATVLGHGVWQR